MLTIGALTMMLQPLCAQTEDDYEYERASLCMMLQQHPAKRFGSEIQFIFSQMQLPERFNNHDLGVKLVSFAEEDRDAVTNTSSFLKQTALGRRLIAKWFNRDKKTGKMNMELVRERGLYNSTKSAANIARAQLRGKALLEDAGELLISNTYFVLNDITYVDKSVGINIFKDVANFTSNIAMTWTNMKVSDDDNPFVNPALSSINGVLEDIKGFKVRIRSYLYRLKWNDDIANQFYAQYYVDNKDYDKGKAAKFGQSKDLFELEYVGMVENTEANTTLKGTTTNEELIRKVCTRAVDKSLAGLQHKFADFRIKAPLISTEPLKAYVGMKEDITEKSRYEVLERSVGKDGKVSYSRVGIIKPEAGKIWDNRYWASEEKTDKSSLDATYFKKVSGGDFYPGMLIREIE